MTLFPSPGPPRGPHRRLDRFEFSGLLGVGGSAAVYRARDRILGRDVAVKLPRDASPPLPWACRARMLREAEALARVRHANVVSLLDAATEDDLAYLVLAPIDGASLRGRTLPWRRVAAIGAQISAALAAAHAVRVIHRDVSPGNILVDHRGRATLIDFNRARGEAVDADSDDLLALALSPAGRPAGTRRYVAPELLRGAPAGPAADQHALCATLLACLAGSGPPPLIRALRRGLADDPEARHPDMHALTLALLALVRA